MLNRNEFLQRVVYESPDGNIIGINKPAGRATHGTYDNYPESVGALVKRHIGPEFDPMHRLDVGTSGVVIFAGVRELKDKIRRAFEERRVAKEYHAVTHGKFPQELIGSIGNLSNDAINNDNEGKKSVSRFQLIDIFENYSLIRVYPFTGRTHQIRRQLAHLGFPIVGDQKYHQLSGDALQSEQGSSFFVSTRFLLHASSIRIFLGEKNVIDAQAETEEDFQQFIERIAA